MQQTELLPQFSHGLETQKRQVTCHSADYGIVRRYTGTKIETHGSPRGRYVFLQSINSRSDETDCTADREFEKYFSNIEARDDAKQI